MKRPVIVLGTFDGVHKGHKKIFDRAVSFARRNKLPCYAVTFKPHPQQFIIPERGLKLLTTLQERVERIKRLGVDDVKIIHFDKGLQNLSYQEFVEKFIVKKFRAGHVFVGYDFAFGWGRLGHASQLKELGQDYGFEVIIVPAFKIEGEIVKSKKLRELIGAGDLNKVVRMMGHPYQISGKVVRGKGVGRKLGFPTANLKIDPHKLIPAHGVYAGRCNGKKCAINIGTRPTFGGIPTTLVEVHFPGAKLSLTGKNLKVEILRRLRNEIQFTDTEELKKQIKKDLERI